MKSYLDSPTPVYVDTAVLIYTMEENTVIHAATAMAVNCDLFITNDRGFRNLAELPVVILSEVLAS